MAIRKIEISNFKSFNNVAFELGDFNALVGANASGKSNFLQIFKFLRDISDSGIKSAISLQGGMEYFTNIQLGHSKEFELKLWCDYSFSIPAPTTSGAMTFFNNSQFYELGLKFLDNDYVVTKEKFLATGAFKEGLDFEDDDEDGFIGKGSVSFTREDDKYLLDIKLPKKRKVDENFKQIVEYQLIRGGVKKVYLESSNVLPFFLPPLSAQLSNIAIYDFEPSLSQKAVTVSGKSVLDESGANLPIVLKDIIEDSKKKKKLYSLVHSLLPFVEDIDVDKAAEKYLFSRFREVFYDDGYFPASLMSAGTIYLTAIIVALYFEKKSMVLIEEPERYIHPQLLPKLMALFQETAQKKQVLITTHSPELVKSAGLENILFVSRSKEGFSILTKPIENREVTRFIDDEIDIADLFVQNLL